MTQFPDVIFGSREAARLAIKELYDEIRLDVLPNRYPTMFKVEGGVFRNLTTGMEHYISDARSNPMTMLRRLGENVEEDFYFMCPNEERDFVMQGFVSCFPQGFVPSSRMGLTVSQIHGPVPSYDQRLKKGVNLCFQRMARGESEGRSNVRLHELHGKVGWADSLQWAIQINHSELFLPIDGANTNKGSTSGRLDIDPLSSYLRCEHHTLICLPKTGVIVFAIRSYLTPLSEIKAEGLGPQLAEACESMPEKFGVYKNRPTWGTTICAWLRDEREEHNAPLVSMHDAAVSNAA